VISDDSVAATLVNAGTGGSITSIDSPAHAGDTSARLIGGGDGACVLRLPFPAAASAAALSLYHYAGALTTMDIISVRHAGGQLFRVGLSGTGAVQIKDSSGTVLGSTVSGAWAIDRWNRIELQWDNSGGSAAGVADLEAFNADGDTPTGTASVSGVNLGTANTASIDVGNPNLASFSGTHYFDSVQMDNGRTTFIGPYVVVNQAPEVTAGPAQTLGASETA